MKTEREFTYDRSRRLFLLAGIGGAAAWKGLAQGLSGSAAKVADPACVLTGEIEEGPYYLDYELMRRKITEDKTGVPMRLRIAVVDAKTCKPLPGAAVDIWHCDAGGLYSGFTASAPPDGGGPGRGRGPGFGPPPGGGPPPDFGGRGPGGFGRGPGGPGRGRGATDKLTFLRGVQITDKSGMVEFETVFPGWYVGRTIHVHAKVHVGGEAGEMKYAGGHVAHTGQFFFPEEFTAEVAKLDPYTGHKAYRTRNEEDGLYRQSHDAGGMIALSPVSKTVASGLVATVTMGVDPEATPALVGIGGGRRGVPGR